MDAGAIYQTDVTQIAKGSNPSERLYDVMNLRGVTIMLYAEISKTNYISPVTVTVALLAPKDTGTPGLIASTNFFRGNNDTRSLDFTNEVAGLGIHTLAINTDDYHVVYHKRILMGLSNVAQDPSAAIAEKHRYMKRYVKIARQVRYNTDDDNATDGRLYFVMYCDNVNRISDNAFEANLVKRSFRVITWFRDPKN